MAKTAPNRVFEHFYIVSCGEDKIPRVTYRYPVDVEENEEHIPYACYPQGWDFATQEQSKLSFTFQVPSTKEIIFGHCRHLVQDDKSECLCIISKHRWYPILGTILLIAQTRRVLCENDLVPFLDVLYKVTIDDTFRVRCTTHNASLDGNYHFKKPVDEDFSELDLFPLFNRLSLEQIIDIFSHLLFSHSVLFVSQKCSLLTNVVHSFLSLMYPFAWRHLCIPVCGTNGFRIQTPAIVGYHDTSILDQMDTTDTIIVDLDNRTVKSQNTIQIPERSKLINIAQKFVDADSIDQERLMTTFLEFFASLVGDYRLYLAPDGFDLHAFLEAHESNKEFLNEFTQTAHWRHFINTKIESLKSSERLGRFDKYCSSILPNAYAPTQTSYKTSLSVKNQPKNTTILNTMKSLFKRSTALEKTTSPPIKPPPSTSGRTPSSATRSKSVFGSVSEAEIVRPVMQRRAKTDDDVYISSQENSTSPEVIPPPEPVTPLVPFIDIHNLYKPKQVKDQPAPVRVPRKVSMGPTGPRRIVSIIPSVSFVEERMLDENVSSEQELASESNGSEQETTDNELTEVVEEEKKITPRRKRGTNVFHGRVPIDRSVDSIS